jgi:Fe-S-cluster-containing hydrogenase component 2
VCPTNVFEHAGATDRLPVIKRQADCQTCFMCEAWCPTDALFVAPQTDPVAGDSPYRDEAWLMERGLLGSYRREIGWGKKAPAGPRESFVNVMAQEPLPVGGGQPEGSP